MYRHTGRGVCRGGLLHNCCRMAVQSGRHRPGLQEAAGAVQSEQTLPAIAESALALMTQLSSVISTDKRGDLLPHSCNGSLRICNSSGFGHVLGHNRLADRCHRDASKLEMLNAEWNSNNR